MITSASGWFTEAQNRDSHSAISFVSIATFGITLRPRTLSVVLPDELSDDAKLPGDGDCVLYIGIVPPLVAMLFVQPSRCISTSCSSMVLYPHNLHPSCPIIRSGVLRLTKPTTCCVSTCCMPVFVVIEIVVRIHFLIQTMEDSPWPSPTQATSMGMPLVPNPNSLGVTTQVSFNLPSFIACSMD